MRSVTVNCFSMSIHHYLLNTLSAADTKSLRSLLPNSVNCKHSSGIRYSLLLCAAQRHSARGPMPSPLLLVLQPGKRISPLQFEHSSLCLCGKQLCLSVRPASCCDLTFTPGPRGGLSHCTTHVFPRFRLFGLHHY